MTRARLAIIVIAVSWLAAPAPAWACSCAPVEGYNMANSVRDAFDWADHVFIGRPVRRDHLTLTMGVEEWWKGGASAEVTLTIAMLTDRGEIEISSCDFGFQPGKRYLVFAHRSERGLGASSCSPTALLDDSVAVVAELDALAPRRKPQGREVGRVR